MLPNLSYGSATILVNTSDGPSVGLAIRTRLPQRTAAVPWTPRDRSRFPRLPPPRRPFPFNAHPIGPVSPPSRGPLTPSRTGARAGVLTAPRTPARVYVQSRGAGVTTTGSPTGRATGGGVLRGSPTKPAPTGSGVGTAAVAGRCRGDAFGQGSGGRRFVGTVFSCPASGGRRARESASRIPTGACGSSPSATTRVAARRRTRCRVRPFSAGAGHRPRLRESFESSPPVVHAEIGHHGRRSASHRRRRGATRAQARGPASAAASAPDLAAT